MRLLRVRESSDVLDYMLKSLREITQFSIAGFSSRDRVLIRRLESAIVTVLYSRVKILVLL